MFSADCGQTLRAANGDTNSPYGRILQLLLNAKGEGVVAEPLATIGGVSLQSYPVPSTNTWTASRTREHHDAQEALSYKDGGDRAGGVRRATISRPPRPESQNPPSEIPGPI